MSEPLLNVSPGDTESLNLLEGLGENLDEFRGEVIGGDVQVGQSRGEARNPQAADRAQAGDRGLFDATGTDTLWFHNPADPDSTDATDAEVHTGAGVFSPEERVYQQSVRLSDNETEAPPRTDAYEWAYGLNVDLYAADGSTVSEFVTVPDRSEEIVVSVDDPSGGYHVEVHFRTGPEGDGKTVTKRGKAESADYDGAGPSDVFVVTAVASPYVEVRLVDDSAAANPVDYTIYAR